MGTSQKMWFGNLNYAGWCPVPETGMTATDEGYTEEFAPDNGGLVLAPARQTHKVYDINFATRDSSDATSFELLQRFAAGDFGTDWLRFTDVMAQDQNLFSKIWANPGLAEQGWKPIFGGSGVTVAYGAVGSNTYGKPIRKPTYSWTAAAANAVPTGQNQVFTILIPPTFTLSLGSSYTATGTAVIQIQPILVGGTAAAVQTLTGTSDASAPAFSSTFSGATYSAVKIYVSSTGTGAQTISPTALWAQCVLTGTTPTIGRHIPGKGHAGLAFRGSTRVENYNMASGHKTSFAATLVETEPWA